MKKRALWLMFILTALVFAFVTSCHDMNNPVIDEWWEGGDTSDNDDGNYYYTHEAYIVSFDSDGGSYVDLINEGSTNAPPQRVLANAKVSVPGLVEKTSNYFGGWYTALSGGGSQWNFETDAVTAGKVDSAGMMVLYAKWESSGCKVHFEPNFPNGSGLTDGDLTYTPKDESIAVGAFAAEPLQFGLNAESEYFGNYVFSGWYKDKECDDDWVFNEDKGAGADITLFAGWAKIGTGPEEIHPSEVYTVKFVNGAGSNPPQDQYIADGGKIIAPFVMLRTGYSFGGWYKEDTCVNEWLFNTDTAGETADTFGESDNDNTITLYAKWATVNPVDIFQDLHVISINYILFSGGATGYNAGPSGSNTTSLTATEKRTNDTVIGIVKDLLEGTPEYRVMIIGHANPTTDADKANPMNDELVELSKNRADSVTDELTKRLDAAKYNLTTTPIITKAEGGRMALRDPSLSRRVEVIIFDITKETVTP